MNEGDPVEILVQGEHIILERYKPHCVLCSSTDQVIEYRERYICKTCVENLIQQIQ
jgi:transcriptional pleiotropic regulator of transition state genes